MSNAFLSSDEYAEKAHQLYIAGQYDAALDLIREGLAVYPLTTELNVGLGYARLAREEYAWARVAFEQALSLEPNQEDGLAGLGETWLKLGERERGLACFDRIRALGFGDDTDLMMQVGRALFREGELELARSYFERIVMSHGDNGEAVACLGYTLHRLGDGTSTIRWLRKALRLAPDDSEVRIYLGNVLYDRTEYDAALDLFEQTQPEDHFEELAVWRLIELKGTLRGMLRTSSELRPWMDRLRHLALELGPEDRLLAEVEAIRADGSVRDPNQLDFFSTLLTELQGMKRRASNEHHDVSTLDGTTYTGTWDDIVLQMKQDDREWAGGPLVDYMEAIARRSHRETGVVVPATDAESFIRGIAEAGLVEITK